MNVSLLLIFFATRLAHAPPPISFLEIPFKRQNLPVILPEGRGAGFFCVFFELGIELYE
jgi:hypothetical protein